MILTIILIIIAFFVGYFIGKIIGRKENSYKSFLYKRLLKRIKDTQKEIEQSDNLNIKISKGAKITAFKELYNYIKSH